MKKNNAERVAKVTETIKTKTEKIHKERKKKAETLKTQGRPPKITSPSLLAYKIADYLYKCDSTVIDEDKGKTEPYTATGLQVALSMDNATYNRYKQGRQDERIADIILTVDGRLIEDNKRLPEHEKALLYDYQSRADLQPYYEYLYCNDGGIDEIYFSTIIQKAYKLIEEQAEKRLYIRGSVADIFTLKARYGWQEEKRTVHRFEIATEEQALKALQDLQLLENNNR